MPGGGSWLRISVSVQCYGLVLSVRAVAVAMSRGMAMA